MAESVWYYARGDVERGPFTLPQIKALVHGNRLRPDDLVWREGMDGWAVAKSVPELFPPQNSTDSGFSSALNAATGSAGDGAKEPVPSTSSPISGGEVSTTTMLRTSRVLAILGLCLVFAVRGGENLSEWRSTQAVAAAELEQLDRPAAGDAAKGAARRRSLEKDSLAVGWGVGRWLGALVLLVGCLGIAIQGDRREAWLGMGGVFVVLHACLCDTM